MNWNEMKRKVEVLMESDPQRATLQTRAWQSVEEGLRTLTSAGYNFVVEARIDLPTEAETVHPGVTTLSIPESIRIVSSPTNQLKN